MKSALVDVLCRIFKWSPALARALGQVVLVLWPGFRRA
jgi:hypothetical protein